MDGLWTFIFVVVAVLATTVTSQEKVEIQLKQGPIYTYGEPMDEKRSLYSFRGIPYAQPPVGDLRFMDPMPAAGWSEPRNGSWIAPVCPQVNVDALFGGEFNMSGEEDCLYLNVFTPRPYSSDLPVMVFIHGGGFSIGGIQTLSPLPLLTQDVVLVTFQYRLGVLGFLSTEDSVLPGNMGLKDQTLALMWVQQNIREFGGDPNRLTIFGVSAGAASVDFHIFSPQSKGLFQQAILQSGNMISPWATYDQHRDAAFKLGEALNCTAFMNSSDLLDCLRDVSARSLLAGLGDLSVWNYQPSMMLPRVDGDYLPNHPAKLLKNGEYNRVPIMTGITKHEGSVYIALNIFNKSTLEELKDNFTVAGPISLVLKEADDNPLYLSKRIYFKYPGELAFQTNKLDALVEMMGDRQFRMPLEDATDIYVLNSMYGDDIYMYELHHRGNNTLLPVPGSENWVGHGDDMQYLFNGTDPFKPLVKDEDIFVSETMVALWTNFAKTGNPTPDMSLGFKWEPKRDVNDRRFLAITTTPTMLESNYNDELRQFWRNLPTQSNKILYPERFM